MPPKSAKQKACAANAAKRVKFQPAITTAVDNDNSSAGYISSDYEYSSATTSESELDDEFIATVVNHADVGDRGVHTSRTPAKLLPSAKAMLRNTVNLLPIFSLLLFVVNQSM
jgi:hypothetical protein